MSYIYIDESGDLGNKSNSSKYFVIASIKVDDSKKLDKIINKVRRNSKKYIKTTNEIKGSVFPAHLKKKILKKINNIDNDISIIIFNKKNRYKIRENYDNNILYDELSSELSKIINITSPTFIFVDKSKNKTEDISIYNKKFKNNLINIKKHPVYIEHANSIHYKGLQIVDLIAWATFQKYEHNNNEFIKILKNVSIKQVFEE